ncbi:MAG: sulfotransferase [Flavobacteriales bacterium]|nr:sulfotransferase [Flavobacteriales bacterium]
MSKLKQIFIVGSSRSGTTMMGRILGNHSAIHTFKELHFFGTIWTNSVKITLTKKEQINLLSHLFCIEKNGLFNQNKIAQFNAKSSKIINRKNLNHLEIYELFLKEITTENSATISCEQTPKNMYYLNEILDFFPDAKVINMVRDQRDVLLSQKNKWKRKFLGASKIPLSEVVRAYINYHPILTAKVWSSSLFYTSKHSDNQKVKIIKFEELLSKSESSIKGICDFLEIDFQEKMLKIPVVGSSTENDLEENLEIDNSKIEKWKKGGLSNAEIYLSQKISNKMMNKFGYKMKKFSFPPIGIIFYIITFPIKLVLSFLLNINRMGNIFEVVKKRFFVK